MNMAVNSPAEIVHSKKQFFSILLEDSLQMILSQTTRTSNLPAHWHERNQNNESRYAQALESSAVAVR